MDSVMMGMLQPPAATMATGSVVRLVHAALLLQGGSTMAREFWSGHPLETEDGILAGVDLHEKLWDETAWYPLDWVLRVFGSLESFCLRYGLDHRAFIEERMLGLNGGCLLPPHTCLKFLGGFLGELLATPDIHLTALRLLDPATRQTTKGVTLQLLRHERTGEHLRAWVALKVEGDLADVRDSELCSWLAIAIGHCPSRMGAPIFEQVRILADFRGIESIVASTHRGEAPENKNGTWKVGGDVLATRIPLNQWLQRHGFTAGEIGDLPDSTVYQIERDWTCPLRGRRMLSSGAIHGAPFGLFEVHWSMDDSSPAEAALRALIMEALGGDVDTAWLQAEALHKQFLETDKKRLRFIYHAGDETISCNGTHLLRGVPAKILQKILIAHTITGRTLYEHREFRRDPDLRLDPSNPNLESRLRILSQRLEERLPVVRLIKSGRGRFQFESEVQVEYDEEGLGVT